MEQTVTFETLPTAVAGIQYELQELKILVAKLAQGNVPDSEKLLSIKQAADLLNLAVPSIYGLVHRSMIPCMKRNKKLYFSERELLAWVKSGRRQTLEEIKEDAASSLYQSR
jgi:predicted DNA-binding transcriptional regulator AlpA